MSCPTRSCPWPVMVQEIHLQEIQENLQAIWEISTCSRLSFTVVTFHCLKLTALSDDNYRFSLLFGFNWRQHWDILASVRSSRVSWHLWEDDGWLMFWCWNLSPSVSSWRLTGADWLPPAHASWDCRNQLRSVLTDYLLPRHNQQCVMWNLGLAIHKPKLSPTRIEKSILSSMCDVPPCNCVGCTISCLQTDAAL